MTETAQGMTDADLVVGARRGDKTAFGQLVRRYETAAYATAAAHLANRHDAEDAVQDAFVGAYVALGRLREPAKFGAWLREIVRRRALEIVGRRRTVRFVSDNGRALASSAGSDSTGDLCEAISLLPPRQREAVLACYGKDTTYERAAEYLGVSTTTLKGRLQMARERLRAILGGEEPALKGDLTMNTEKIEKNVAEAVAKIASREISVRYPLNGAKSVVFFGGVGCEVEVCQTDGDAVVVTGTATSVGLTPEDAERSVNGIRLEGKTTRGWEFLKEAVICVGNNWDDAGNLVAATLPALVAFQEFVIQPLRTRNPFGTCIAAYPELARLRDDGLANAILAALDTPKWIGLFRAGTESLTLPRDRVTSDVRRGFATNYSNDRIAFGTAGAANLVIAVPAGVTLTLVGSMGIRRAEVHGVRGDVNLVAGINATVEDVEGSVRLFNARLEHARNVRGDLSQVNYYLTGTDWSGYHGRRTNEAKCNVEGVTGDVSFDLARVDLDVSGVDGAIDVRNRWGATRVRVGEPGKRVRIESDSGPVTIVLPAAIVGDVGIVANSICGDIRYAAINEAVESVEVRNDWHTMSIATVPAELMHADHGRSDYVSDIVVTTRAGDVAFEVTK